MRRYIPVRGRLASAYCMSLFAGLHEKIMMAQENSGNLPRRGFRRLGCQDFLVLQVLTPIRV